MNLITKVLIGTVVVLGLLLSFSFWRNSSLKESLEDAERKAKFYNKMYNAYKERLEYNQEVAKDTSQKVSTVNKRIDELKHEANKVNAAPVALDNDRLSILRRAIKESNATTGDISK